MDRNDISLYSMLRKRNGYNDEPAASNKENEQKNNSNAAAVQSSNPNQIVETILDNGPQSRDLLNSLEGYCKPSTDEQQEYLRVEALIKDVLQNNMEKLVNHPISSQLEKSAGLELIPEENAEENILDYDQELQIMMNNENKRAEEDQRRAKDIAEVKKLGTKMKNLQKNFEKLQPAIEEKIDKTKKKIETSIKLLWPKEIKNFLVQREKQMRAEIERKFENINTITRAELELDDLSLEGSPYRERDMSLETKTERTSKVDTQNTEKKNEVKQDIEVDTLDEPLVKRGSQKGRKKRNPLKLQEDDGDYEPDSVSSRKSSVSSKTEAEKDQAGKSNKNAGKQDKSVNAKGRSKRNLERDFSDSKKIKSEASAGKKNSSLNDKSSPDYQPFEPIDKEEELSNSRSGNDSGDEEGGKEVEDKKGSKATGSKKTEDDLSKKKRGRPKKVEGAKDSSGNKGKGADISQESSAHLNASTKAGGKSKKTFKETGIEEFEIDEEKSKGAEGKEPSTKKPKKVKKGDDVRNQLGTS